MTQSSRGKSSGAPDEQLRPVWPERNPLLVLPNGTRVPVVSERTALENETRAHRALIASGRVAWPPPILDLTRDPDEAAAGDFFEVVPREFDWRHPRAFVRLDTVNRMELARLDALTADGHPSVVAGELIRQATYQLYMQAMWAHHGRRVYRLDPGLTELLLQTKLPRLPASSEPACSCPDSRQNDGHGSPTTRRHKAAPNSTFDDGFRGVFAQFG